MICEIENICGRVVSFSFNGGKTVYVPTKGSIQVNSDEIRKNEFFLKLVKQGKLSVKHLDKDRPIKSVKKVDRNADKGKIAEKK